CAATISDPSPQLAATKGPPLNRLPWMVTVSPIASGTSRCARSRMRCNNANNSGCLRGSNFGAGMVGYPSAIVTVATRSSPDTDSSVLIGPDDFTSRLSLVFAATENSARTAELSQYDTWDRS